MPRDVFSQGAHRRSGHGIGTPASGVGEGLCGRGSQRRFAGAQDQGGLVEPQFVHEVRGEECCADRGAALDQNVRDTQRAQPGQGVAGRIFWVIDQLDSLVGMLLFIAPIWTPSLAMLAAIVAIMLVAHPVSAWVMMWFGLKDRVG